jgi:hypothetical protein
MEVNGSGKHSSLLQYGNYYIKNFIVHAPGVYAINLFTVLIKTPVLQFNAFIIAINFHPNLIFEGKARSFTFSDRQ